MHSPVPVALLHTPHVENMAMAFQASVLEPLVRRGVMRLTAREVLFARDHLLFERIEGVQLLIVFLSQGIDRVLLRGIPLLESLRRRHGRSALVLPVLAQATFESEAEGFLPLPMAEPPADVHALVRLAPAVEQALFQIRSLTTNFVERPPPKALVGRDKALEDIAAFFDGGVARFICLTAPFGRGTSSLARAYAESVKHEFPGGFIEMSSPDDDEASRRLADSLGIHTLPSNLQSPAVPLNDVLASRADTLIVFETSFREFTRNPPPMFGARMIITTHVEMSVPTAYTYQVPPLDPSAGAAFAEHLGLEGPLVQWAEGEPLAYKLIRSMLSLESDEDKILQALTQAKRSLKKDDLHESWLTPIAAFFSVWWSLLPDETRRVALSLSLCPPSGMMPRDRAQRFAELGHSFDPALEPLLLADLVTPTTAGLLVVQPALLAWIERFQSEARVAAGARAQQAQERALLDVERIEREHTTRGTDVLLEEMSTLRQAGLFGASDPYSNMRGMIERGRGFFKTPRDRDRPEAFLQFLLNQGVRFDNPELREKATNLLEGRELVFLQDRFVTGGPNLRRILRERDKRLTTYSMRAGHAGVIVALASTPRGLLSAGEDGLLLYWDVTTGVCLGAMDALPRSLSAMAGDVEGTLAIVGSSDGTIHVWNLETFLCQARVKHPEPVSVVASNPLGTAWASAGPSGAVLVWKAANGEVVAKTWAHQGNVTGLAWLDHSRLASVGADGVLRVWNGETMQCLHARYLHGPALTVAPARNGTFATLDASGHLSSFSGDTYEEIRCVHVGARAISCAIGNDGEVLFTGYDDGVVRVWQGESGRLISERADRFPVRAVVALGPTSFAHSEMNVFRVVDVRSPGDATRLPVVAAPPLQTTRAVPEVNMPEPPWPVVEDAISTSGALIEYTVSQTIAREEIVPRAAVHAMTNSPTGELIVLGLDASVHVFNLETLKLVRRFDPPFEEPFWPTLSVDGSWVLSAAPQRQMVDDSDSEGPQAERTIEVSGRKDTIIWDTSSNQIVATLPREVEPSMLFTKTAAGNVFLAMRDGMEIWDPNTTQMLAHRRGECIALSKSGRWAAIRAENGILIEDVDSGKPLRLIRGISGLRGRCLLRHDGRALVMMEYSNELTFVDTENGTVRRVYRARDELRAFAFSADENLVFIATKEGEIDIRETLTGVLRGRCLCPNSTSIRFLVPSSSLVVVGDRAGMHVFDLPAHSD